MEYQKLGASSLNVSPICFGGNVFGWTATEKDSFRILDAFLDAGFNFIDTADVYSRWADGNEGGESEIILGKWLKSRGRREKIVLATVSTRHIGRAIEIPCADSFESHHRNRQTQGFVFLEVNSA